PGDKQPARVPPKRVDGLCPARSPLLIYSTLCPAVVPPPPDTARPGIRPLQSRTAVRTPAPCPPPFPPFLLFLWGVATDNAHRRADRARRGRAPRRTRRVGQPARVRPRCRGPRRPSRGHRAPLLRTEGREGERVAVRAGARQRPRPAAPGPGQGQAAALAGRHAPSPPGKVRHAAGTRGAGVLPQGRLPQQAADGPAAGLRPPPERAGGRHGDQQEVRARRRRRPRVAGKGGHAVGQGVRQARGDARGREEEQGAGDGEAAQGAGGGGGCRGAADERGDQDGGQDRGEGLGGL
ncbi:hypothetical protein DFJ74DRAFT_769601, partial [Hyaloraphidium curvatum]